MAGTGLPIQRRAPSLLDPPPMIQQPVAGSMAMGQAFERLGATGTRIAEEVEHAERTRYISDMALKTREKRVELAAAHPDDPEKFSAAWAGYADGVLGGVDQRYAEHARRLLETERLSVLDNILSAAASKSKALAADSIKALTIAAEGDILSAAYRGGVNDPAFELAFRRAEAAQMDGVRAGLWSEDSARLRLDQIAGRAKGEAIIGSLRNAYETGGRDAALADLETFRRAEDVQLDPREREMIVNRGESFLRQWEADRSAGLTETRAAASELKKAAEVGVADETAVASTVARLEALGDRGGAAALRRAYSRQEVMANVASMPEAEHERLLQSYRRQSAAAPATTTISPDDREALIRTALAEAGNQGADGLAGVVYTILNRTKHPAWGGSISDVVNAKNQFEPVMRVGGDWRKLPGGTDKQRQEVAAIVDEIAAGVRPDPTEGATYFLNRRISAQRGTDFGAGKDKFKAAEIGDHTFYRPGVFGEAPTPVPAYGARGGGPDPELLRDLETGLSRKREALRADPLGYAMQLRGAPALPPIDWAAPAAATEALLQRQTFALKVSSMFNMGVVTPFTRSEIDGLKGRYDDADASGKVKILGTLARSLDPAHLGVTLGKLADDRPAFAVAGSIYAEAPEVAEGVVRGEAAMKADSKAFPVDSKIFREDINRNLGTALSAVPAARGAYVSAILARYADLSVKAGKTGTTDVDSDLLEKATADVTGGLVEWNPTSWGVGGTKVLPPRRGMAQRDFENLLNGLTNDDFSMARTPSGTAVTADDFKRLGNLVDRGGGRYSIVLNDTTPVLGADGRPFVLDLGGR